MHFATRDAGDGRALRYHFDEFLLEWLPRLARTLAALPPYAVALRHVRSDELLRMLVEQALYVDLLYPARVYFSERTSLATGAKMLVPPDLVELVRGSLPEGKVQILPSSTHSLRAHHRKLRQMVRNLAYPRTEPPGIAAPRVGVIAVELVEGADLAQKCDAFWLAAGGIDPSRVLFVLEEANRSLVDLDASLAAIRRLGSRVVAVDPFGSSRSRIPLWKPRSLPDWSAGLQSELRGVPAGPQRWLAGVLVKLAQRAGFWESFYREFGVQLIQQFSEGSPELAVKRIAIDRVGGIEMGKMRSQFFEHAGGAFIFLHEAALVWHRSAEPILRKSGARTRVIVETGYVYDYLREPMAEEGAALRRSLSRSGATVVAAVYDNHSHIYSHTSVLDLEAFYRCILALTTRHEKLGLVIKTKKPEVLALLPADVAAQLSGLRDAGRCLILDKPLSSVLPAALASDLAFGFPASTAACEAALAGCRTVMYDPSRASGHPWAVPGMGIMFDSIEAFASACDEAIAQVSAGQRGLPRARLLEIDPFLDGKAPVRAAAFINAFLLARADGQGKDESIATALQNCADFALLPAAD